jgi:hypothetical protein
MKLLALAAVALTLVAQDDKPQPAPPPPGSITGAITDSNGAPMKDVEVYAHRNTPREVRAVTDAQGHYTLRNVAPGQVRLSVAAPDSQGRTGWGPNASRQLPLAPGQDLANVDFRLTLYGRITGKVVDQNKEPVADISVFLVAREYSYGALRAVFAGGATTDDLGEYRMERIQPNRAYAVVATRRWRGLPPLSDAPLDPSLRLPAVVPTYHPSSATLDSAEMLTLDPGEIRENVDIRIVRSPSLCLDAILASATGPRDLRFEIAETQPASGRSGNGGFYTAKPSGRAGQDGKIRVCDLHRGDYELSIDQRGTGPFSPLVEFGSAVITLADRDLAGVHVALRPKIPVSGEVVWDGPAPDPLPTTKLHINLETITRTERANVQTDLPGQFTFEGGLAIDDYGLDVTGVPNGVYIKDITYAGRSILYTTLNPGATIADSGLRITLARDGGTIAARVTDKDGNPVSDANVVVLPAVADSEAVLAAALKSGKTDRTGLWTTPALPPGKYYVLPWKTPIDRSPETISALWKTRTTAQALDVAPNAKTAITLAP